MNIIKDCFKINWKLLQGKKKSEILKLIKLDIEEM